MSDTGSHTGGLYFGRGGGCREGLSEKEFSYHGNRRVFLGGQWENRGLRAENLKPEEQRAKRREQEEERVQEGEPKGPQHGERARRGALHAEVWVYGWVSRGCGDW